VKNQASLVSFSVKAHESSKDSTDWSIDSSAYQHRWGVKHGRI
jgi:hypothetical protein